MTGEFVEPAEGQNVNDERWFGVHDENWCPEGYYDGELRSHDHVGVSVFNSFLRLRRVRMCS